MDDTRKPGTFKKGDPRINRKGRPKTFSKLRELAQAISHEAALAGGQPLVVNGHVVTVAEAILRQWASSKNPQLQQRFIEVAYGKPAQEITLGGTVDTSNVVVYLPDNGREKDSDSVTAETD